MSWLVRGSSVRDATGEVLDRVRNGRDGSSGAVGSVSRRQALRNSVAWACLRLRADLVSTMPIDVFRKVDGVQFEQAKPPVMINPGGDTFGWEDWLYASQFDLDSTGNDIGVVRARDGGNRPAVIELLDASTISVRKVDGRWKYASGADEWDQDEIWHERQYPIAGFPLGLSPIAHAALALQPSLSAAEFAVRWFGNNASPSAHLKNTARKLNKAEARSTKANFKTQLQDGDVFVSGNDWTYTTLQGKASEAMFLEQHDAAAPDICRYLGVPGDMVDVPVAGGAITYANITQRNLQLLIMNLNPALIRREKAFTNRLLPAPRYAKFNRGALTQMDLKGRLDAEKVAIDSRTLTVSEARALEDRPPLTDEQVAEFAQLFPQKSPTPVVNPGGTPS